MRCLRKVVWHKTHLRCPDLSHISKSCEHPLSMQGACANRNVFKASTPDLAAQMALMDDPKTPKLAVRHLLLDIVLCNMHPCFAVSGISLLKAL